MSLLFRQLSLRALNATTMMIEDVLLDYDLSSKSNLTMFEQYKFIARQLMTISFNSSSAYHPAKVKPRGPHCDSYLGKGYCEYPRREQVTKVHRKWRPPRETAMKNATRLWRQLTRKQTAGRTWLAGRTRGFTLLAISGKAMMTTSWRRPTRCTRCTTTSRAWSARWSEGWGGRESRAMGRNA